MSMTLRERILAVYRGQTPDVVPFMLDLSHWFYHQNRLPWDLSRAYLEPERELIDYHRRQGVGFYIPNLASFFEAGYGEGVQAECEKSVIQGHAAITWRLRTPLGTIQRIRTWEEQTYAWATKQWGIRSEQDLRVLGHALAHRRFQPCWDRYRSWQQTIGDTGVAYLVFGYSAMGQLLNYWMGIERTMYAVNDWPETVREVVQEINANNLECIDLLARSPAEVVIMGDNFSGDVQPPRFFERWSRPFYEEATGRLHAAGKYVAVHVDGRLKGALGMIRAAGADCADAVTPTPMGDLTPAECRAESGPEFILSGGVSPDVWLPNVSDEEFRAAVLRWLELARSSPRLIAAAGDQVPPGAAEHRVSLMRDLVETYGRY
jgi:uroporphyrinogen-III decarboxylase